MLGIDTIWGLPVHVLVNHFAVVLVPLAAIAFVALCWKPEWRDRYALSIALLALAGAAAAVVAAASGDALQGSIRRAAAASGAARPNFGDHPEDGDLARIGAVLMALAACVLFVVQQWGERLRLKESRIWIAYGVGSVLSFVALGTMIVAGHTGVSLVWKDLGNYVLKP